MFVLTFLFLHVVFCQATAVQSIGKRVEPWLPRELGRFTLKNAGFIEVFDNDDGGKLMIITTFNPALPFHDDVWFMKNPGNQLGNVAFWKDHLEKLGGGASAFWPNFAVHMPSDVLGFEGMCQTSGFLVPGKGLGQLELYDISEGTPKGPVNIVGTEHDWWSYHWVVWKDIDNDGLVDALTARFTVPTFGDPRSQLVWFKNPGTEPPPAHVNWDWQHFIQLEGGPDVYFEETLFYLYPVDGAGQGRIEYSVIVTGELWNERVMLYYVENIPGAWADPENIKSVVVDAAPGQPFEAHFADLNNDGVLEILASCYDTRPGNETGNLWVYEQSSEGFDKPWKRTAIASGFIANPYLFGGSMAPGKSRLFWPSEEYKTTPTEDGATPKPFIALSGDDDGVHYILYPKSEDPASMEYDMHVLLDTEETTAGTMAVADLDGDGFMEIISAGFTAGKVYVHTFAP